MPDTTNYGRRPGKCGETEVLQWRGGCAIFHPFRSRTNLVPVRLRRVEAMAPSGWTVDPVPTTRLLRSED